MRIDHIALQVNDIKESVEYYKDYGASVIHQDDTWAFLQFDNIKLALVIEDEHPYHIAFEVDMLPHTENVKKHRDGSISYYIKDPRDNTIEIIQYPRITTKHFADEFHGGEKDIEWKIKRYSQK